ncbi:Phox [Pyrrhoderma noxium]|uniref:Endosomal/vacuolar adapter protein YPT35 n=1 Tax=Pyrrhoderma noxium TaxID=2282107 RepID=A0A286UKZ6_9AGAM|nr:Phox [Pyrrhoderma noxium]
MVLSVFETTQSGPSSSSSQTLDSKYSENKNQSYNGSQPSSSILEIIRDDEDKIDVVEEDLIYRAFDLDSSDVDSVELSNRNSRKKKSTRSLSGAQSHTRSDSYTPSILSNDIWVGESGDAEKDSSFSRGVKIVGWTSVGDKHSGAYVVYDCALLTTAGTTIHVHKRYSAFVALHSALMRTVPTDIRRHIPPLPPRTPLARYRAHFLEKRRKALQTWLGDILLHPELGGTDAVIQWVTAG